MSIDSIQPKLIDIGDVPLVKEASAEKPRVKVENTYKTELDFVLEAPKHFNRNQLAQVLRDNILNKIESDANSQKLLKQSRDPQNRRILQEVPYSFDQILFTQIENAIDGSTKIPNPKAGEHQWQTYLTSQLGMRETVAKVLEHPQLREPFISAVRQRQAEIIRQRDGVAETQQHELSPEHIAEIADDMAEEAVEEVVELDLHTAAAAAQKLAIQPEQQQSQASPERNPKLAKLFSPYFPPKKQQSAISNEMISYALATGNRDELQRLEEIKQLESERNEQITKQAQDYKRLVNVDTEEYSINRLTDAIRWDAELQDIMKKAGHPVASRHAVQALREDADLRYQVGDYFLQKLSVMVRTEPETFGARVERNSQKQNAYVTIEGLPQVTTSREYAAWLALAKVSGMFNYKVETASDGERYDESDRVANAQHRHAADAILYSPPAKFY